jgi:hypothetical protein
MLDFACPKFVLKVGFCRVGILDWVEEEVETEGKADEPVNI